MVLEVSVVVFLLQGYLTSGSEVCYSATMLVRAMLPFHIHAFVLSAGKPLALCSQCSPLLSVFRWLPISQAYASLSDRLSVKQALVRTLVISGVYAVLELLIEVLLIFGYRVPLFFYG